MTIRSCCVCGSHVDLHWRDDLVEWLCDDRRACFVRKADRLRSRAETAGADVAALLYASEEKEKQWT